MRTHNTVYVIPVLPEHAQEARCKALLAEVVSDDQLSDPAHRSAIGIPATGQHVPCEAAINCDPDINRPGTIN